MVQAKVLPQGRGGLRFAQDEVAAVAQGVGEQLERAPLQLGGEVDQNVTAYHQVYPGEGRTPGQVVLAKDDHAPHRLLDLVVAALFYEIAAYLLFGEARDCGGRVDPVPRSEEHTPELQSRQYLVCRLLLEKKHISLCSADE